MDECKIPEELREGRAPSPALRKPAKKRPKKVHGRKQAAQQRAAEPALSPSYGLGSRVFLEIFSGSGRLGNAILRELGMAVLLWDITYGDAYDLTKPVNQHKILNWMKSGFVVAGHLGTACGSFSRARDRPNGPPRLRSDQQPLGLPDLRPADQKKVMIGNTLMRFTVRVLLLALTLGLAFTLENPALSRLWICPPILALMRRRFVTLQQVEYCMFDTAWKKPTKFLATFLNLDRLQVYRCLGSKRGLCLRTGMPHVPLVGQTADGRWLTSIAEPYPRQLCKMLARCFRDFFVAQIAHNFSRHL